MSSRFCGLILFLAAAPAVAGPFCVISSFGTNCNYFVADACNRAARASNGMCVANQNAQQQQPQLQTPDIAGSFQRGMAEGQRQRIEREEHEARMALMQAQADEIRQQQSYAEQQRPNPTNNVIYRCTTADGGTELTEIPGTGCTVIGYTSEK